MLVHHASHIGATTLAGWSHGGPHPQGCQGIGKHYQAGL